MRLTLRPRVLSVTLTPSGAPSITLRTSPLRVVALDVGGRGPQGPVGQSAYALAVAEGFAGDEAAWLASLVGPQGPPGAAGAAGSVLEKTAGAALGGHRVVVASGADEVLVADVTDAAHLHRVLGITEGAAVQGDGIGVRFAGEMTEGSWSWTPDAPIYVGAAGVLTQTPPVGAAWLRIVAVAISATRIVVGLREPVLLAA